MYLICKIVKDSLLNPETVYVEERAGGSKLLFVSAWGKSEVDIATLAEAELDKHREEHLAKRMGF